MSLELWVLLVDAMMFLLIWLVQIIIYPGFLYYNESDMKSWHTSYTGRITYFVLPLMLGQLILHSYTMLRLVDVYGVITLLLLLVIWYITFFVAIPLHGRIDSEMETQSIRNRLVRINWYRTLGWTIIFILNLITYGQ